MARPSKTRASILAVALALAALVHAPTAAAQAPSVDECLKASSDGQTRRDEGRYLEARSLFRTCASQTCPAIVRQHCDKWRSEMEEALPTVVFAMRRPNGTSVAGASVSVDGRIVADRLTGTPVAVDPGERTFVFRAGSDVVEQKTLVVAGEKNRLIAVNARAAEPELARVPEAPALAQAQSESGPPVATLALFGVGAVALGAFGVLALTTQAQVNDLRRQPCAATRTCPESETDSARTRYLIADVALGAGLVAIGVGATLWVMRSNRSPPSAVVQVVPGPGQAVMSFEARFY